MNRRAQFAIIGIGSEFRHDDAVGLEVARLVRQASPGGVEVVVGVGDDLSLLAAWQNRDVAYVVDCTQADATPGTIRRFDARNESIPAKIFSSYSTHAINLVRTVELSRILGRLPRELVIVGVEGADVSHGCGLTGKVRAAAIQVADLIAGHCKSASRGPQGESVDA